MKIFQFEEGDGDPGWPTVHSVGYKEQLKTNKTIRFIWYPSIPVFFYLVYI